MSSGKITPSEEERISSMSLDSEPLRRILSVSIVGLLVVGCLMQCLQKCFYAGPDRPGDPSSCRKALAACTRKRSSHGVMPLFLPFAAVSVSSVCPFNPFKFSTADGQASRQTRLETMVVVKI